MFSDFSDFSLALVYLLKIDKANDLRIMAESLEDSANRFYQALVDRHRSSETVERYIKTVVDEAGELLR